jgi:hypothetical protein
MGLFLPLTPKEYYVLLIVILVCIAVLTLLAINRKNSRRKYIAGIAVAIPLLLITNSDRLLQLLFDTTKGLIPSQYFGLVLILTIVIGVLAMLAVLFKGGRPNYVLGIVIAILLVVIMASNVAERWSWMLGLLPALLVAYQAFYLWLSKPQKTDGQPSDQSPERQEAYTRMNEAIETQYAPETLFIRYGLPAALLGIIGIVILNVLVKPGAFLSLLTLGVDTLRIDPDNVRRILLGLRLGAVGAYVYVLLELGRRTFRHDVTGASAMWCLVTLVLGPVLSGTVALLWRLNAPAPDDPNWWAGGVVLFFAGFAPRRVIAAIAQAAVQLLKIGGANGVAPTRQIPLSQVRGIGPSIEDRLSEEGIEDVNSLASAEPVRLYRNTSFDLRQILNWIDEAILIVTLPRNWQTLEEEGITGAIDLAWYQRYLEPEPETPIGIGTLPISLEKGSGTNAPPATGNSLVASVQSDQPETARLAPEPSGPIEKLADKVRMDRDNLEKTIRRLSEDRQLLDIWALYDGFTDAAAQKGTGDGNKPPSSDSPKPKLDDKSKPDASGGDGPISITI